MGDPQDLLDAVFARPDEAVAAAHALLADSPSAYDASIAHHVIGLAQREYGDLDAAIAQLRRARALATRSGSAPRWADVVASLGIAVVHAGRSGHGLALLDQAVAAATGAHGARVRFLRAGALWILGRHREALADLRIAVPVLRRSGDVRWAGRALTLRGLINLVLGLVKRADTDLRAAERVFADLDERHASAFALHNRGLVAFRSGDLPAALSCLDDVERRYRALGTVPPELAIDRCAVLLAAGLAREAVSEAGAALERTGRGRGRPPAGPNSCWRRPGQRSPRAIPPPPRRTPRPPPGCSPPSAGSGGTRTPGCWCCKRGSRRTRRRRGCSAR
ncbi:tetratricopeptide repeat protein [Actinokineospora soli]|uniref:Tetratricopeptide repeat protein n=1 Tax=Actinokineospora soli TaxID=1048753 RepID=A0ABW2TK27_9PSEU